MDKIGLNISAGQIAALFNNAEGRDKFTKVIQYGARFLKEFHSKSNPELFKRLDALFSKFKSDKRKRDSGKEDLKVI